MTAFANEYGDALFALAREEGLDDTLLEQAETLNRCFSEQPEYLRLLDNRFLTVEERSEILRASFSNVAHAYLLNFLLILCRRGAIHEYADCVKRYRRDYNECHRVAEAAVTCARPLTQSQRARLTEALAAITGKRIELTETVNEGVIGGLRVDVDGRRIDDTVKTKLETLRNALHADN